MEKGWKIILATGIALIVLVLIVLLVEKILFDGLKKHVDKNNHSDTISEMNSLFQKTEEEKEYIPLEELKSEDFSKAYFIENRYYTIIDKSIVYHKNELDKFIENVSLNIPDEIRCVQFTNEGGVVIKNLEFNKNIYVLKTDYRWSNDADKKSKEIVTTKYDADKYKIVKENNGIELDTYKTLKKLNIVGNDNQEVIYLCDYIDTKVNTQSDFELEFKTDMNKGKEIILSKSENSKCDYDIYSYNGDVNIIINGEKTTLRDALLNNKITIEQIMQKAEKDANEYKTILCATYLDGGSKTYIYDNYTILKCNILPIDMGTEKPEYNVDLYIGNHSMNISEAIK